MTIPRTSTGRATDTRERSTESLADRLDADSSASTRTTAGAAGPLGLGRKDRLSQVTGKNEDGGPRRKAGDEKSRNDLMAYRRALRETMQTMTESDRQRKCGVNPTGAEVMAEYGGQGHATLVGLQTCGNKWVCAVCASRLLAQVSALTEAIVAEHAARGGAGIMMTNTVAHKVTDSLEDVAAIENTAWNRMQEDGGWKKLRKRYGITLTPIWGLEVTHGFINGWHPHRHTLLLADRPLSEDELVSLQADVYAIWERKVTAQGAKAPSPVHGVHVTQAVAGDVEQAKKLADYVVKGNMGGLAAEITGGTFKKAKGGNRTPMEILADIHAAREAGTDPDPRDLAVYYEFLRWVNAKNRTMFMVPPRIAKALDIDIEAVKAAALKAVDGDDDKPRERWGVLAIPRAVWLEKLARYRDRQDEFIAAVASGTDPLDARLRGLQVLGQWGIIPRQIMVRLGDRDDGDGDGDDGLPTHAQALSRDLRKAALAS